MPDSSKQRYWAIRVGKAVEIRAAKTPPKGLHSTLNREFEEKDYYSDYVHKRKYSLKQTTWSGGRTLGVCRLDKFSTAAGMGIKPYGMKEISREVRLKALRDPNGRWGYVR